MYSGLEANEILWIAEEEELWIAEEEELRLHPSLLQKVHTMAKQEQQTRDMHKILNYGYRNMQKCPVLYVIVLAAFIKII